MTPEERDRLHPYRCELCRDAGAIVVPHPDCIDLAAGALVGYEGARSIRTIAVGCSECERQNDFRGLPRWDTYTRRFGGLDLVRMLADHERPRHDETAGRKAA